MRNLHYFPIFRWNRERPGLWSSMTIGGKFRQLFPNPQAILDCMGAVKQNRGTVLLPLAISKYRKEKDLRESLKANTGVWSHKNKHEFSELLSLNGKRLQRSARQQNRCRDCRLYLWQGKATQRRGAQSHHCLNCESLKDFITSNASESSVCF